MIQIKDNLIPKDIVKACAIALDKSAFNYGWPSNINVPFGHWNFDITRTSQYNPTDVATKLPKEFKAMWDLVNKEFFKGQALLTRCYANKHTFGTEGYVHTDSERKEDQTVVVYLNEEWNYEWGGETMFYEKGEAIRAVVPKMGRVASFPGNIPHCAKALSRLCPKVRTTLMFKVTIDPKAIYDSEQLLVEFLKEIGADKKPHKNGTLLDHLLRVYHLLKSIGANDILALAGGLHSVYSTNTYKLSCLSYTSDRIHETFGPEVDRIVRLFCTIDRPKCLEVPNETLTELDLFLLRCIECANLHDQDELNETDYPNLYKFSMEVRNKNKG